MTIESIFNETELAIFQKKTGFNFNDCYKLSDGTIFALDRQSRQIFVGDDLTRSNVHSLDSLSSVRLENGQMHLKFNDLSSVYYAVDEEVAEALMAELRDFESVAPDCHRGGTMTRTDIFETVRKLKPGDRVHIEFKPLIGKLRVYDGEYIKLEIDIVSAKYFSLKVSGSNFDSLMDDVAGELYDYIDICFFSEEKQSELSLNLDSVTMLKIIPQ